MPIIPETRDLTGRFGGLAAMDSRSFSIETLLLVEHNMQGTMGLCERITVIHFGTLLTEGSLVEVRNNPDILRTYLGGASHDA